MVRFEFEEICTSPNLCVFMIVYLHLNRITPSLSKKSNRITKVRSEIYGLQGGQFLKGFSVDRVCVHMYTHTLTKLSHAETGKHTSTLKDQKKGCVMNMCHSFNNHLHVQLQRINHGYLSYACVHVLLHLCPLFTFIY